MSLLHLVSALRTVGSLFLLFFSLRLIMLSASQPPDNSPLASTFPGRPINGPPGSSSLARVVGWVAACDSHGTCLSPDSSLPTRLIDVGGSGPETTVRLVEPEEGSNGRYTALSYCWGVKSIPYSTTSRSIVGAREVGMNLGDLPQTFQDAIAMTRRLGVRYIWIDSLCICQDDVKDWERESSRMASVYCNAYLTIAATGSSDAGGGLFFDRPDRSYLRTAFRSPGGAIKGHVLVFPLLKGRELNQSDLTKMFGNPLNDRGWAFQERVLARRVLHFAVDQISLECLQGTIFEDGLRLPLRYQTIHRRHDRIDTLDSIRDEWREMLYLYSIRDLTFLSDKLPALSGIAKIYAGMLGDEYVAGLWRNSIIEELSWRIASALESPGKADNYRAPSWSWASVDVGAQVTIRTKDGPVRKVATALDYHVEIDGDNPFGKVKGGWVKVEAPLIPLCVSDEPCMYDGIVLSTGSIDGVNACFDRFGSNYSASAEVVRQMKLFALVLADDVNIPEMEDEGGPKKAAESNIGSYSCIVVTPVDGGDDVVCNTPGLMKRVDSMDFWTTSIKPGERLFHESSRAIVTLV
jgi:hypothetical protein